MDYYQPIYATQTDAILLPQLIRLEKNLIMACFRLMKLVPAKYVVEKAWREGRIDPKLGVIETSSGTYALGLAMVCAELKIPFHIVSDPAIDARLQNRLQELGGTVTIVNQDAQAGNLQVLRMAALQAHRKAWPGTFWPQQYDNPENQDAYRVFAEQLLARVGKDMTLVGAVGSGSSTCGTIKVLREVNPAISLIGVDTFGSVLFGLPNGKRMLRGLGNSLHPKNIVHSCYDHIHWIDAAQAFARTRELHGKTGLFMGPTSGAAYAAARFAAQQNPQRAVVFIAADEGYRYADSIYDDKWLQANQLYHPQPAAAPRVFEHPGQVEGPWACVPWGRRELTDFSGITY